MPPEQDDSPEPSDTKALTQSDVGNMVNAAVTAHMKRFTEKQFPELLGKHLESAMKPIAEKIATLQAPAPPSDEETSSKGKKSASPEVAALKQQLEEALRAVKESDDRRSATEKKAREDRAFSSFKNELGKHVRPDLLDVAADYLFRAQGLVQVDDDGEVLIKSKSNQYGFEGEQLLPMKDGVEAWAKSEGAKAFIPAPGAGSQVDQVKRNGPRPPAIQKDIDLSKASPEEKIAYTNAKTKEVESALRAAGLQV